MRPIRNWLVFLPLLTAASCVAAPADPEELSGTAEVLAGAGSHAAGGGHYALNDLSVHFAFNATQRPKGTAHGQLHVDTSYDGLTAEFHAKVTCLAVDEINHRAWVGGVITMNNSTDPDYGAPIYQPGKDVWFRAVDYGSGGASIADRSTFVGFEGAAGFLTSADYCAGRPWPEADARTWPLTGC
jgi:hypothetical protein